MTLWIVGRQIPNSIKKIYKGPNVIFDENASFETEKIFRNCGILIFPNLASGGISFKVLEAMSSGIPVVTTKLTLEGLEGTPGKNILICKTASEFSDAIETLFRNKLLYDKIARNARSLIEEKYDWENIVKELEKAYEETLKND